MARFILGKIPIYVLFFSMIGISTSTAASNSGFFGIETNRLGLLYSSFSGDKNIALTGNTAFGIEAALSRGNSFLQFTAKIRVDYSGGNTNLLDSGTVRALDYRLLATNAAFGIRIYPVMSTNPNSLGVYFGGVGTVGIAQLTVPEGTYTSLQNSQTSTTTGYDVFAGIDFSAMSGGKRLFIETALRTTRTKLGGSSQFQIDGLVLQSGLSW